MKNGKDNVHDGHRKRLKERYKVAKNSFLEHELIELLLTFSIPRKDTNKLAHEIIKKYGSIENLLKSDKLLLQDIEGVGESTYVLLDLISHIYSLTSSKKEEKKGLSSIEKAKEEVIKLFRDADHELFYVLYLNSQDKVTSLEKFDSGSKNSVAIDLQKLSKSIVKNSPHSIIVAHNHFTKYPKPSLEDDTTTCKILYLLSLLKVNFYDHLIVSGDEIYSYFYDNRMQSIKEKIKKELF